MVEGIPYEVFEIKVISDAAQPLWALDVAAAEVDEARAAEFESESCAETESEASLDENMAAAFSSMSAFLDD